MRVCIDEKDSALLMDATNWATGVIIRKWKSKKITPSEATGNLAPGCWQSFGNTGNQKWRPVMATLGP